MPLCYKLAVVYCPIIKRRYSYNRGFEVVSLVKLGHDCRRLKAALTGDIDDSIRRHAILDERVSSHPLLVLVAVVVWIQHDRISCNTQCLFI
jgi:hypothetical protein